MVPAAGAWGGAGATAWGASALGDPASILDAAASSARTPVAGGTTAGVASRYGAVTLVGLVLGVGYLWWRLRRPT